MANNQSAVLLEYSKLQIAAEAMFGVQHNASAGDRIAPPDYKINPLWLTDGNDHSSRFTTTQAAQFVKDWSLVEHQANTATGFSGTLFKYIGEDNPDLGLVKNQLVMSFRSTEFIEDSARDNQATNTLELSQSGWAFGQIADMEKWYADLKTKYAGDFASSGNKINVTGYSLGGSLATTFNLLHPSEIGSTYTFNGAGVGMVKGSDGTVASTGAALTTVMTSFKK